MASIDPDQMNWDEALDKLTTLTNSGQIRWEEADGFSGRMDNRVIHPAYTARLHDRQILIYEFQYRSYTDSDEWHWAKDVEVEFVDSRLALEYTWRGSRGYRWALLDAIRFHAANVENFIEELLKD